MAASPESIFADLWLWIPGSRALPAPRNDSLLLEAVGEPLEQPPPDIVLAGRILDTVFEVGVVVDFHDDNAVVGLLEVDAVKTVADRPRRAHRDIHHLGRRLGEIEGAEAALMGRAVRSVFHHLPMAARHTVLADEQWLAGQHPDPPIEIGRQEFLRQEKVGLFEQLLADALERCRRFDLVYAAGKRAV